MKLILVFGFVSAGIVHLIPVTGFLGADRLSSLYAIKLDDPNLVVLMRHRAVLFGLLGALLIAAAFIPHLRVAALTGGYLSVLAFLYLAWGSADHSPAINRIFQADIIALLGLVAATVGLVFGTKGV